MRIYKIEFRNINSYGNKTQVIELPVDEGSFILLEGDNGTGKSTIKQSMELPLFAKVQGKNGKKLANTKLPNRRNGALYTGIFFINNNGDDIIMKRFIKPNDFTITVNGVDFLDKFKIMSEKERDLFIGHSFDVFKTFISLNMNDFKNFISLTKDGKDNILNKLFNISIITDLHSITNKLLETLQSSIQDIETSIENNIDMISDYNSTVTSMRSKHESDLVIKKVSVKNELLSKKPRFDELGELLVKCDAETDDIKSKNSKLAKITNDKNNERNKLEIRLETLEEKIKHYESGECPVCNSDLKQSNHVETLETMLSDKESVTKSISECDTFLERCTLEGIKISNRNSTNYNNKKKYNAELSELKTELASLKKQYSELNESQAKEISVSDITHKISELKTTNAKNQAKLDGMIEKSYSYREILKVLSVDGIRRDITDNIIAPVNSYLSEFLTKLDSEYTVVLDNNFDAKVFELNSVEIDPETLSKGEDRKINIAIALAYLKIVISKNHTNILFLDEIFDGTSVVNIDRLLVVLKELSREHKINIIIVHHDGVNRANVFDKRICTTKNIFSDITMY